MNGVSDDWRTLNAGVDFDFYDIQSEDGSFYGREWDYQTALDEAVEAAAQTGLWHEVHGVKVLERVHREKRA